MQDKRLVAKDILRLTLENMQNKLYMFHYIQIAALNQNLSLKLDSENNSTLPIDYLNNLHLLLSHNFPNASEIKVPTSWQKPYNIQGDNFGENIVTALTKHSFEVGDLDSLLHNLSKIEELDSSSWQKSNPNKTLLSSLKTIIIQD